MNTKNMFDDEKLYDLADLFRIFGDTTRIKILYTLRNRELCVNDLAQSLNMTQSAVSHQLKILRQSKLVRNRREGKSLFYSLNDHHVVTIIDQGMEHICE
ncbi:metalloregulator ArsR/SmtB family transcription factor [Treponema sp. HNW]|uniref:ArsR/SmtB family transcription factor n=1 Tax=Treponema sp. HNW TaxID=3116654 RepID=UPI003D0C351A